MRLFPNAALVAILLTACGSSSSFSFPSGTQRWVREEAVKLSRGFDDPHPQSVWVNEGRYTLIVLTGRFRCLSCSRPPGSTAIPRGTVAAFRLDSVDRLTKDFALCSSRSQCMSGLCAGNACSVAQYGLDSALSALDAHTRSHGEVGFDRKVGFHRDCGLRDPAAEYGVIKGNCRVTERVEPERITVTFIETWHALDRSGRRTSAGPLRRHIWRVIESGDAWVRSFSSSGDPPPQFESCRSSRTRTRTAPPSGLSCSGRAS